jgi:aldose 1-epimerase
MALKPQEFPGNIIADHGYIYSGSQINVVNQDSPTADQETPILLSAHHYWNFEAYQETQDLSGHYARIDSSKIIATDGLLIPNGSYVDVNGTALDLRKSKSLGQAINDTGMHEYCGTCKFNTHWS